MQLLHFSKEFCYDSLIAFMLAKLKNCAVFTHVKCKSHITPRTTSYVQIKVFTTIIVTSNSYMLCHTVNYTS